jgi:sporulation protein YlmC with PRC-barrel domain
LNAIEPEEVLGKEVVQSDGLPVGPVVDVGVHDARRVKFLLVEDAPRRYVRLTIDRIDKIGPRVILKP